MEMTGLTALLNEASKGKKEACDQLFRLVESTLRARAHAHLRGERPNPALQTTVLVDDAFLKLFGNQQISWESRSQFYEFASRVMWQMLIDAARKRDAGIRPDGKPRITDPDQLAKLPARPSPDTIDELALDEALTRLTAINAQESEIARRHLLGWTFEQIAEQLNIPPTTVKRRWTHAQGWLHEQLTRDDRLDDRS